MPPRRRPTSTSNFGAGRRESHDASAFYGRFTAPTISDDDRVNTYADADRIVVGDARDMRGVPDACVALVVTSPPYFAGKAYEEEMGQGHVPADYVAYLEMLRDVFAECARVLEPGGRIAVNVANLGRKPYRSLASDVNGILQDELGLLLRGEVVWVKGKGATGSTAWGSFQSAANPVLRDLSERIVIASKGRFDRAIPRPKRAQLGLPHENSISKEEFMDATLDVWNIAPESAKRVGHPAPFPVELPARCLRLFTYVGDLVLDPFMGSGTTAVAAVANDRRFLGFETDPAYAELAETRIATARSVRAAAPSESESEPDTGTADRAS
jgi:site-specific DNA-methyltransferase (adenine-specific)